MNNKKAISGIIITVVLVVLVLVSITIVWNVISDIIADQAGNVDSEAQCIGAGLTVSSINCDATPCSVVMKRQVGANANPDGLTAVFTDVNGGLVGTTIVAITSVPQTFTGGTDAATDVSVRVYFNDTEDPSVIHECQPVTQAV